MANKRNGTWLNDDGLRVNYGTRETDMGAGKASVDGAQEEIFVEVDLAQLSADGVNAAADWTGPDFTEGSEFYRLANFPALPAGSFVQSVTVATLEAGVGGTSITVGGIRKSDGGIQSGSYFLNAVLLADHNQTGETVVYDTTGAGGGGSAVGDTISTASDIYPVTFVTGTYTAGKVRITVRYTPANTGIPEA